MFSKVFMLAALAIAVYGQDHQHGHAYSSQSIVRHDIDHGHQSHGNHNNYNNQNNYNNHNNYNSHESHNSHIPQQYFSHEHAPQHVVVQQAAPIHHSAPAHQQHQEQQEHHIDYYAHPKYEFEYKVEDPHTGDNKFQHESRDGDVVKGVYSLHDADGSIRTVEYNSDKHSGFNAYVKHTEPKHQQEYNHHH